MTQLSLLDYQPQPEELAPPPDDFRWLQQLQVQVDEVQEQIDVAALAKEPLAKSSPEYRVLQKHLNAEVKRRAQLMTRHDAIASSRGYQLLVFPEVSGDGNQFRYVYHLANR